MHLNQLCEHESIENQQATQSLQRVPRPIHTIPSCEPEGRRSLGISLNPKAEEDGSGWSDF